MNIFEQIRNQVKSTITTLIADDEVCPRISFDAITVERPRDPAHGDMATNAAMVLSKPLRQKPRDLAAKIAERLALDPDIVEVSIAGPGFLNIRLAESYWLRALKAAIENENYGASTTGQNISVNVEYVSANPTGPLHVGHCRGAVFGDALANLLGFAGFDVTKEYYINDAGGQVETLCQSAYLRYLEALGENIGDIPEGLYPGEYLKPVGLALLEKYGTSLRGLGEEDYLHAIRQTVIDMMMDLVRADLSLLNIHHDVFFSEQSLHNEGELSSIAQMLSELRERDLVYEGHLPPPKGTLPDDWEDREQTLFRATHFGDDIDRALKKSNGDYTYFAADVAYFRSKFKRDFEQMVYVLGADHGGYVKRLEAVGNAIAGNKAKVVTRLCQLVKLLKSGEPVKMSKRAGNFITVRNLVEEVGSDPVRFTMLYRRNDAPLDFDYDKVTEQSRDNAVFYVQYAHARCCSIFRQVGMELPETDVSQPSLLCADLSLLDDEGEMRLIKSVAEFPRLIETSANTHEPHRVSFYLYEISSLLHAQWNKGRDIPSLRFVNVDSPKLTIARLALIFAVKSVIQRGLNILGVSAPGEMR